MELLPTDALPTTQLSYRCEHVNEILTHDKGVPYITAPPVIHWFEQIGGVGLPLDAGWTVIDKMSSVEHLLDDTHRQLAIREILPLDVR